MMKPFSLKTGRIAWLTVAIIGIASLATTASEAVRPGAAPDGDGVELWVSGKNETSSTQEIWVRVDGPNSYDFASRTNLFRAVQPGEFTLRLNVADLADSNGKRLQLGPNPEVRVFEHEGSTGLSAVDVYWKEPVKTPAGIIALDFGAPDGPVFPGFDLAVADDDFVAGARLSSLTRPGVDALARDGISGVELVELSPPPGRYVVKLWLDDLGAWEFVPHALRQRVRINGENLIDRTDTPEDWVKHHWAGGSQNVWRPGSDAWDNFGDRRSGVLSSPIDIGADGLRIEFAGDRAGALFLAALAVVPEDSADWFEAVEHDQAIRFSSAWPIDLAQSELEFEAYSHAPSSITLARGQTGWLRIAASDVGELELAEPKTSGGALSAKLFVGQRRLDRSSPLSPALAPLARTLVPSELAAESDPIGKQLVVEVTVPNDAAPGVYLGAVNTNERNIPFEVVVTSIDLPPAPSPVGVYLADPPHHHWLKTDPRTDRACRFNTLASMGLTGLAPPLATPTPDKLDDFRQDVSLAGEHFGGHSYVSYQELQRLFEILGPEGALEALPAAVEAAPDLIWSAADEPSNPGLHGRSLADHVADIRTAAPTIRLAGHLNSQEDRQLLDLFDIALVNPGFGMDLVDFDELAQWDVEGWIYNTGPERLAAGFYGWRVGSKGYLMWHAMMPTADPFDPTDGREGDAILLPPVGEACAETPAIDERLIRIAEGAADRRWLAWLDETAAVDPGAARLRANLLDEIPSNWDEATQILDGNALDELRAQIAEFASKAKGF